MLACEAGPREGSGSQWAFEDVFEDYDLLLEFDKQPKCGPLFNAEKPGALLNAIWILNSALTYVEKLDIFVILVFRFLKSSFH